MKYKYTKLVNMYNQLIAEYNCTKDEFQKGIKYGFNMRDKYRKLIKIFDKYKKKYLHYEKIVEA